MYGKPHRSAHRWKALAFLWPMVLATFAPTDTAYAFQRDVTLRFLPSPSADVTGYRVYAVDEATQVEDVLDVGFVQPDLDGIARTVVSLDEDRSFLVAMTAYSAMTESALSNAIQIAGVTTSCDPLLCDDGRDCTADSCDAGGCLHTPLPDGSSCDDGYVDTTDDRCGAGVCEGVQLACRDDLDCDDENVCNGLETCGEIACFEGIPLDCGPPTQCAASFCDPLRGCGMAPVEDGVPCEDGLETTIGDTCQGGVCTSGGEAPPEAPHLAVDAVSPEVVSQGSWTLTIRGSGFETGATLSLEEGKGRAPRVQSLRLVDSQTLQADLYVSHKGHKRSRLWDVVVTRSDGSQARLRDGLEVAR